MKLTVMTPLAIRIGAIPWMPKLLPQITATDKFVQRVSKGRVTILDIAGLPNLMLTVKGRKSGVPRTTPLLCVPHEGGNLIAGSNFGQLKPPVWVVNVRAAIEKGELVGVDAGRRQHQAKAREITGAERDGALGGHGAGPGPTTRGTPSAPTARSRCSSSTRWAEGAA